MYLSYGFRAYLKANGVGIELGDIKWGLNQWYEELNFLVHS